MRGEDDAIERWEAWDRQDRARKAAHHRSRMRWWKHAREYLSLKRLVVNGLTKRVPDHPPWSHDRNWWPKSVHWSRTSTS